jgi:tetratricopeptide (TPR) repeat protein
VAIDRKKTRDRAQKQLRKGNWERALQHYEDLVDDDPSDVRSRLKIADLYSRLDQTAKAVAAYEAAGDHHSSQDIYQKAVAAYKQALRLSPDDGDLQRKLADAYYRIDRLRDADHTYRRALKSYKQDDDRDGQIAVLEELTDLTDDIGIQIQLAENYAQAGRREESLRAFRKAAEALYEEGRVDEFIQVAERVIYFDPDDRETRKRLTRHYARRGDYRRALKHLQVCFNNDPRDVEVLQLLAETFRELDQVDKAAMVLRQLAELHKSRGDIERTRLAWERVLEIKPEDPKATDALQQLGADDTAEDDEEVAPEPPPVPEGQAPEASESEVTTEDPEILSQVEDLEEADDVQAANEEESLPAIPVAEGDGSDELTDALQEADVFIKYGLEDQAREILQELVQMAPEDVRVLDRRRRFYESQEQTAAAGRAFVRMAEVVDDTDQARDFLEQAIEMVEDREDVLATARKLGLELDAGSPPPPPEADAPQEEEDAPDTQEVDIEFLDEADPDMTHTGLETVDAEPEDRPDDTSDEEAGEFMDISSMGASLDIDFDDDDVDSLFEGFDETSEPVHIGSDDPTGDMAEIDFFIQQGLYEEAEEALQEFEENNPGHPGVDKRRYQIRTARQGGTIEENPSGSESLTDQFADESFDDIGLEPEDEEQTYNSLEGYDLGDTANQLIDVGAAYRDMGLYDEAIEEFERALEDPEAAPQAKFHIAVCRAEMGETDDALSTLRELLDRGSLPGDLRSAVEDKLDEIDTSAAE